MFLYFILFLKKNTIVHKSPKISQITIVFVLLYGWMTGKTMMTWTDLDWGLQKDFTYYKDFRYIHILAELYTGKAVSLLMSA